MSLLDRASSAAFAAIQAFNKAPAPPEPFADDDVLVLRTKLAEYERAVRQNKAYYDLVQSLCGQRDQWKDMFQKQAVENAAAQSYMNEQLEKATHIISSVVSLMNAERRARNVAELRLEHKLDTGAVVKKRFDELLAELRASAPADCDGPKERDRIAAEFEPSP